MDTNYEYDLVGIDTETGGLNGYFNCSRSGQTLKGSEHYPLLEIALVVPKYRVSDKGVLLTVANGDSLTVGIKPNIDECYTDLTEWAKDNLSEWAFEQHTKSGLLARLETGEGFDYVAPTYKSAEAFILGWLEHQGVEAYNKEDRTGAIVYGNNIAFDLDFIDAKMPNLVSHFHYRKIDVSTINVLARSIWSEFGIDKPNKALNHTALADILESTEELNLYTQWLEKQGADHA
ncbi:hypothetical protein VPHK379_0087 [Vibrio phage K379]|nr:oligoribonuclease [Vibrio phage PS14A.1]